MSPFSTRAALFVLFSSLTLANLAPVAHAQVQPEVTAATATTENTLEFTSRGLVDSMVEKEAVRLAARKSGDTYNLQFSVGPEQTFRTVINVKEIEFKLNPAAQALVVADDKYKLHLETKGLRILVTDTSFIIEGTAEGLFNLASEHPKAKVEVHGDPHVDTKDNTRFDFVIKKGGLSLEARKAFHDVAKAIIGNIRA